MKLKYKCIFFWFFKLVYFLNDRLNLVLSRYIIKRMKWGRSFVRFDRVKV